MAYGKSEAVDLSRFRPIHYLGSKLRLVDEICQVIDRIAAPGRAVVDLFAGSGTVSGALSLHRRVVAIDVQEYSRVLCSAILHPMARNLESIDILIEDARSIYRSGEIAAAFGPLVEFEEEARQQAARGNSDLLCDFLEGCSFVAFERHGQRPRNSRLADALSETQSGLLKLGQDSNTAALATRHFGGVYFSFRQTLQLDSLLDRIFSLPMDRRDSCLAGLLSTASDIVNTVGKQFAQPIRPRNRSGEPKHGLSHLVERDRSIDVFSKYSDWMGAYSSMPEPTRSHQVLCADYRDGLRDLPDDIGLVYADPPYTRDHYSRFYHVLETLSLRDDPDITEIRRNGNSSLTRGLYREQRHQSDFCIKSRAPGAFSSMFQAVRNQGLPLVFSYSPYDPESGARPRLLEMDQVVSLAREYFKHVDVQFPKPIAHSKLNSTENNYESLDFGEALIVCE